MDSESYILIGFLVVLVILSATVFYMLAKEQDQ